MWQSRCWIVCKQANTTLPGTVGEAIGLDLARQLALYIAVPTRATDDAYYCTKGLLVLVLVSPQEIIRFDCLHTKGQCLRHCGPIKFVAATNFVPICIFGSSRSRQLPTSYTWHRVKKLLNTIHSAVSVMVFPTSRTPQETPTDGCDLVEPQRKGATTIALLRDDLFPEGIAAAANGDLFVGGLGSGKARWYGSNRKQMCLDQ